MKPIRLVLADDHPLILEGFKSLLARNAQFEIAGEASNGKELLDMIAQTSPEIVLTDINMPRLTGLEVMQKVLKENPEIKFIMLTMHEEREYVVRCLAAGAKGYLLKSVDIAELANAIKTVHQGGKYFSPAIANILAESISNPISEEEEVDITPREKEVLLLVSQGHSTKQIADKLSISIRTVETHRINLLKKLNVGNSAELVKKAIVKKLI
jgi:DNA-binding NarL/FixJ family response regulator